VLRDGRSEASRVLEAHGADLAAARPGMRLAAWPSAGWCPARGRAAARRFGIDLDAT
jgi:hypothetical protein